jgi:outer membrane protein OmpA-like peptidoglycan-associated protein/tetratricopeptide (TPR) repeat protein
MVKYSVLAVLYFLVFTIGNVVAQVVPQQLIDKTQMDVNDTRTFEQAIYFVELADFSAALPLFEELVELYPTEPLIKYLLAQCYLKENTEEKEALPLLEDLKKNYPQSGELYYWLGKSYQFNYDFDKAIENYEFFIKNFPLEKEVTDARLAITHCKNSKGVMNQPNSTNVVNLGGIVNSIYSEYAPVIVEEYKTMYYTFIGDSLAINNPVAAISALHQSEYYEDVYSIVLDDQNKWSVPKRMDAPFNTDKKGHHDASVSISNNRKYLFVYKSKNGKESGDLILLKKNDKSWEFYKEITGINSESWEGSACMTSDEKFIYFSSDRAGSIGGKDIFRATLLSDGNYGAVINLGKEINSQLDEDAPFISYDGKVFYFSSQGHNSIGGYDLFSCDINDDGSFGPLKNLGFPINSISDDIYLTTSLDGRIGYMSSRRPGGFGQFDLYQFETDRMNKFTYLYLAGGKVVANGKPVAAKIQVFDSKNELESTYHVSFRDGDYKITLTGGELYHLVYTSAGLPSYEEIIDLTKIKSNESKLNTVIDLSLPKIMDSSITIAPKNKDSNDVKPSGENVVIKTENKPENKSETKFKSSPEQIIELNRVFFDFDQTLVKAEFNAFLNDLAKSLGTNKSLNLIILGHADNKGDDVYNLKLSKKRANAVLNYLVVRGVKREQISIIAKGENMPLEPNENLDGSDNPIGRAKNRRVEFEIKNTESVRGLIVNKPK